MLDEQLGVHRFVAGPDYSIADITALVAIDMLRLARIERPKGVDHLDRWYAEISARASTKA